MISSGGWEILKIPAIAFENKIYNIGINSYEYKKGQILNQERDQLAFLNNVEQEMGVRNFAAQFLQDPLPSDINLLALEDILYYEELTQGFEYFVLSWDTAIKISEKSDYSVGTCWGVLSGKFYLVSMVRKKMSYPTLKNEIEKQVQKYKPRHIIIEDKASGQSLIQDLSLAGYSNIIKPSKPKLDKITRFASVIPLF